MTYKIITTLLLLLASFTIQAATLHGKVISVADGDTLTMLVTSNQQVKIRLAGIDAPEKAQPFGNKSKQALSAMTFQKFISVEIETVDRYGRTVGKVHVEDIDVNASMVQQGYAWVYRQYTNDQHLYALEREAQDTKRGLWADNDPISPWEWRRGKRDLSQAHGDIIGNKRSKVYHLPGCPSYDAVSEKNRVPFTNEDNAQNSGYRKAGNCP